MHIRKQEHFLLNWKQDGGIHMTEADYAGFRDGIRVARLFHELEEEPLSE